MSALICVAKNENLYIEEWCKYYLKLGFSKIFIYDNSDNFELTYLHSNNIVVIKTPGTNIQVKSYNHFLNNYKKYFKYAAFFDCDEFLVLKKHKNIMEFCEEYLKSGALGINWYFFGNNNKDIYENKSVLERFTKRENKMNHHVKTIIKCSDIKEMNIHNPTKLINGAKFKNILGEEIMGAFNNNMNDEICQLNHYFTKSTEEFKLKCDRGNADGTCKRNFENHKFYLDYNEIEDLKALNFYLN